MGGLGGSEWRGDEKRGEESRESVHLNFFERFMYNYLSALLIQRDRLCVEFFDFVLSGCGGSGGRGDLDFH